MSRRSSRENRYAVALLVGAVAIAAVVIYARFSTGNRALDEVDCLQSGLAGTGIVILDVTDELSEVQQLDARTKVKHWVSDLPSNTLVRIVTVASRADAGWQEPGLCKAEILDNPLISNPTREQQRQIRFNQWLDDKLSTALNLGESAQSPILETVQWAGLTVANEDRAKGGSHRFLLVSDLIQNTSALSFLRGLPDFNTFSQSSASERLRAPLEHAEVEMLALTRDGFPSPRDLVLWWEQWLRRCGARVTGVQRIVG